MKTFISKIKNPADRRYFLTVLGAKLLGVAVLFAAYNTIKVLCGGSPVWADDDFDSIWIITATDTENPILTIDHQNLTTT